MLLLADVLIADRIIRPLNHEQFDALALELFNYQIENVSVYREYVELLGKKVSSISDIPFLPISFFKSRRIADSRQEQQVFASSGTTGQQRSRHYVADTKLYERSFRAGFENVFGPIDEIALIALLPSYQENSQSSLLYMVDDLIKKSVGNGSRYVKDFKALDSTLVALNESDCPIILFGVSHALLDYCETKPTHYPDLIVMETGGMKGRKKEMVRSELHKQIKKGLGVKQVYSEYGMSELLSQAYSFMNGIFHCPPWMKVLARDTTDPFSIVPNGKTGALNIIDLANVHSCAFIATDDLGKVYGDGSFEVLGRLDQSDIRGCNLLYV